MNKRFTDQKCLISSKSYSSIPDLFRRPCPAENLQVSIVCTDCVSGPGCCLDMDSEESRSSCGGDACGDACGNDQGSCENFCCDCGASTSDESDYVYCYSDDGLRSWELSEKFADLKKFRSVDCLGPARKTLNAVVREDLAHSAIHAVKDENHDKVIPAADDNITKEYTNISKEDKDVDSASQNKELYHCKEDENVDEFLMDVSSQEQNKEIYFKSEENYGYNKDLEEYDGRRSRLSNSEVGKSTLKYSFKATNLIQEIETCFRETAKLVEKSIGVYGSNECLDQFDTVNNFEDVIKVGEDARDVRKRQRNKSSDLKFDLGRRRSSILRSSGDYSELESFEVAERTCDYLYVNDKFNYGTKDKTLPSYKLVSNILNNQKSETHEINTGHKESLDSIQGLSVSSETLPSLRESNLSRLDGNDTDVEKNIATQGYYEEYYDENYLQTCVTSTIFNHTNEEPDYENVTSEEKILQKVLISDAEMFHDYVNITTMRIKNKLESKSNISNSGSKIKMRQVSPIRCMPDTQKNLLRCFRESFDYDEVPDNYPQNNHDYAKFPVEFTMDTLMHKNDENVCGYFGEKSLEIIEKLSQLAKSEIDTLCDVINMNIENSIREIEDKLYSQKQKNYSNPTYNSSFVKPIVSCNSKTIETKISDSVCVQNTAFEDILQISAELCSLNIGSENTNKNLNMKNTIDIKVQDTSSNSSFVKESMIRSSPEKSTKKLSQENIKHNRNSFVLKMLHDNLRCNVITLAFLEKYVSENDDD